MARKSRTWGIRTIGWMIFLANALLVILLYILPPNRLDPFWHKMVVHISTVAVFPLDFFTSYLEDVWLAHYYWILVVMLCSVGVMLLNRFARTVFIFFNILHIVILTCIVMLHFGGQDFLDYFFRLYFNLVAFGTYVGYLTIPDVRELFRYDLEKIRFQFRLFDTQVRKYTATDANSYYNLGIAYARMDRYHDAIEALEKAVSIDPGNAEYHFHLGGLYLKQRQHDQAIKSFQAALRINPIHVQATECLAQSYREEGCEAEALRAYERLSHINPENFVAYRGMGVAYNSLKRYTEAVDILERAAQLNPRDDQTFYQLGIAFFQLERYKETQEAFNKAVRLAPTNKDAFFQLGIVNLKLNKPKEALRCFKQVLQLDADDKQAHYQLGFTYALLKDVVSARREYMYLKAIDRDLSETLALLIKE